MTASPGAPGTGPAAYQPAFQALSGKFNTPARFTPTRSTARWTSRAGIRSCTGAAVGIGGCGERTSEPELTTNCTRERRSRPKASPGPSCAGAASSALTPSSPAAPSPPDGPSRHEDPRVSARTAAKATALDKRAFCARRNHVVATNGDARGRLRSTADIVTALAPARRLKRTCTRRLEAAAYRGLGTLGANRLATAPA